jgi:hypothetical protein
MLKKPRVVKHNKELSEDFIHLPAKNFEYRGITWSRSTLIRLADRGEIKMPGLRLTGSMLKRRMIIRSSLDAFIDKQLTP